MVLPLYLISSVLRVASACLCCVRQISSEVHFDFKTDASPARFAATAAHVEAESPAYSRARSKGLRHASKNSRTGVKSARASLGRRVGTPGRADWALVDSQLSMFQPEYPDTAGWR